MTILEIFFIIIVTMLLFIIYVKRDILLLYLKINTFKGSDYIYTDYLYTIKEFPLLVDYPTLQQQLPNNIEPKVMESIVLSAINTINTQCGFEFFTTAFEKTDVKESDILKIRFAFRNHGDDHIAFDGNMKKKGKPDVLAHSLLPPNKAICLDVENSWNEQNLKSVLLHELGHALGLLDNNNSLSIMSDKALLYEKYQHIDILNLILLYPWIKKYAEK